MSTWMLKSPVIIRGSLHKSIGSRMDENCSRKVKIETEWFLEEGSLKYIKIIRREISEKGIIQSENSKDDTSPDTLHFRVKKSRQRSASPHPDNVLT